MNIPLLNPLLVPPPYINHKNMKRNIYYLNQKGGYVTLLSVLVVGAIGIAVTSSLLLLGLSSSRTSLNYQQMYQAKNLANLCAEEGLEKIRENSLFTGLGNLTLGQGTCTYNVINSGGNSRTINTTGTVQTIIRESVVNISAIDPLIIISSWQEI